MHKKKLHSAHRISNPSDVNSIPTMATMSFTLLFFHWEYIRKFLEKQMNLPEAVRHEREISNAGSVEGLYCKRPIQCLASSKILTLHPPHRPASVYPPASGSIFWKTSYTALYSTFVSTLWQGGKNWILYKEVNANRFFWDSQWLERPTHKTSSY